MKTDEELLLESFYIIEGLKRKYYKPYEETGSTTMRLNQLIEDLERRLEIKKYRKL